VVETIRGLFVLIGLLSCQTLAVTAPLPDHVAALQFTPAPQMARNRAALAKLIERAASQGAQYLVLPELSLTGSPANESVAETIPGPQSAWFAELAHRHRIWLAAPIVERAGTSGWYVTTALFDPDGKLTALQRKRTPRPDGSDGKRLVRCEPKAPLDSIDVGGRRIGVLSGDDLRLGIPHLAERGADLVLVSAGWRDQDVVDWRELSRGLSRTYGLTLVVASPGRAAGIFKPDLDPIAPRAGLAIGEVARRTTDVVRAPLGLPTVPIPATQIAGTTQIEIGRALFFETGLSSDRRVSCAGCHQPERSFTNGARVGQGVGGQSGLRNVPSLLNVAYRESLFWDGSSSSLENLAKFPMSHANEMNFHYLDAVTWVRRQPYYAERFRALLGDRQIEFDDLARALAAYQRTLVSGDSPFDRYSYGGRPEALSAAARRGLALFSGKAGCAGCHVVGARHALFTDQEAHNTGVGYRQGFVDLGRGALDDGADKAGFFLTPSLRNVALTAPYMHDGSLATLEQVVDFYDGGGHANPLLDPRMRALHLSPSERRDLVEFLRALTGKPPAAGGLPMAAVSFAPAPTATLEANRRALADKIREAALHGARFVVLPEFAQSGPLSSVPAAQLPAMSVAATERWLAPIARQSGAWVSASALAADHAGRWHQVTVLIDDRGNTVMQAPKQAHRSQWGDGDTVPGSLKQLASVSTPLGRIGVLAGDDLAAGIPRLATLGAATVLVSASWESSDVTDWRGLAAELSARHHVNLVIANLGGDGKIAYSRFEPADAGLAAPLGLPPAPLPTDFVADFACEKLGRELFFDPRLSRDGSVSCATCHLPERDFGDGQKVPRGVQGRLGHFNVPSLFNVAYRTRFFWDGRVDTLEGQVRHAVQGWAEMDSSIDAAERYLREHRGGIGFEQAVRCIATFERTLLAASSPFDRHQYGGDANAISEAARRGLQVFVGKGACNRCHSVGATSALFTDNQGHNTGIGYHKRFDYLGYGGDGLEGNLATKNTFHGEYITPSLRNIARSAPYMHNGSLATLAEVVDFYDRGGNPNPHLDPLIRPLHLSAGERSDLIEFLTTLTGDEHSPTTEVASR
jgi:cytochrome c peroxidase